MTPITIPKSPKVIERDGNRAVIEISELYPGYGPTIGNALRRSLYSSLEGAAITSVKFEGVPHEFSTIEGVLEDVLEVVLNLKEVRLILHGEEPQILKLNVKGKKEITAKDIDAPSQVEIVSPDTHIATLTTANASIHAELHVEHGLGYVPVEEEEKEKKEIGVIKVDAAFSPILKVNFTVENMRVGDRTDYNRLLLDITTDGTITPDEAYEKSVQKLVEHFAALATLEGKKAATIKRIAAKKAVKKVPAKKTAAKKTAAKKPAAKKARK
jgi:DNA-directed RNA polymerase subunit alpha